MVALAPVPMGPSRLDVHPSPVETSPSVASSALPAKVTLVPWKIVVPEGGAVIVTSGGVGGTVNITCADPTAPSESVTDAVSVWRFSLSVLLMLAPAPSAPSLSELHWTRLLRGPSKSSLAVAVKPTGVPAAAEPPSTGARIVTTGATFGVRMRTTICVCRVAPALSVTAAVIVCNPTASAGTSIEAPVPSGPATLDDHVISSESVPSSTSVAAPCSVSGILVVTITASFAGDEMVTTGGWSMVTVTCACPVAPLTSITFAVTVCVPGWSVLVVIDAPAPRVPSMLDVHWIWLERLPLSASVAAAVKVIALPRTALVPDGGALIVTTGAVFCVSVRMSCGLPLAASRLW